MELTQEQVNHIVDIAETYQTELDDASARFRRRLIEAGLPMGPAGRLVERERYFRHGPAKMPRITFVEERCCGLDVLDDDTIERER